MNATVTRSTTIRMLAASALLASAAVGAAGCGGDDGSSVDVVLSEWIVEPDPDEVSAGKVTFTADNQGGETHEMVIARAANVEAIPTDDLGAASEEDLGEDNVVDEIEDIENGTTKSITVDLEPGTYVLFCNIIEDMDGETESHFAEGMHATFTVN